MSQTHAMFHLVFFSASISFTNSYHYNDKNLESQASISVTQYDWIFFPTRTYMFKAANKTLTHFTPLVFFYTPWKKKKKMRKPGFEMFSGDMKRTSNTKWSNMIWKWSNRNKIVDSVLQLLGYLWHFLTPWSQNVNSEPCQTSKMERSAKIVNG